MLSVSLSVSPSTARVGDSVKVAATVANTGTARAAKVTVSLRADAGVRVKGSNPAALAQLQPGRPKAVSWNVCALEPGNYLLLARVTLDGNEITLARGEYIDIPIGAAHRIENPGEETMIFIEVQQGDYLGEDDIVRLQDDYGRSA